MGWQSWPHSVIRYEQGSARLGEMSLEANYYLSSDHRGELSRGILGSRWVFKNTGFEKNTNCLCVCLALLWAFESIFEEQPLLMHWEFRVQEKSLYNSPQAQPR